MGLLYRTTITCGQETSESGHIRPKRTESGEMGPFILLKTHLLVCLGILILPISSRLVLLKLEKGDAATMS